MGIGDWDADINFNSRPIRENVSLLSPNTLRKISNSIVSEGHEIDPEAVKRVRADSFVVETNIHHPTESSLIVDGVRKVLELCVILSSLFGTTGWRQHEHLLKKVKQTSRNISRISSRKETDYKSRLEKQYRILLKRAKKILK